MAHAADGDIVVGAARSRAGVAFTVLMKGEASRPGDEARIFERFARLHRQGVSGTGLGLAIVKGFVSLMGAQRYSPQPQRPSGSGISPIEFPAESLA